MVTDALLQLNLGNGQLDVLNLLLDDTNRAAVGLDLSSQGDPLLFLSGENGRRVLELGLGGDLGAPSLGLPVGVDGDVALLLVRCLVRWLDIQQTSDV